MAESPGSELELLRSNLNLPQRTKYVFFSLLARSTRLPMSVTVLADDLALRDLEERKLKIEDLLEGCGDIFRKNGLNFSYAQRHPENPPMKWMHDRTWFDEYVKKGSSAVMDACLFEAQDIFLQLESPVAIFLTGHLQAGDGCANGAYTGLRGRGIAIVGTGNYDFWRNVKEEKILIFWGLIATYLMLLLSLAMIFIPTFRSALSLLTAILAPLVFFAMHLFVTWAQSRMSDFEYANQLFQVLAHEQGHLFGLKHVDDRRSVMFRFSSLSARFDGFSKKKLQKALRRCNEIEASFYKTSVR